MCSLILLNVFEKHEIPVVSTNRIPELFRRTWIQAKAPQVNPHKTFNDPVHGSITLHPLLVKIVDTPEFQRLRNIKQLGAAYYVYLYIDKLDGTDKNFVKELINGGPTDGEYRGRPSKTFLYEIISNKVNGVDVDKWDYFARDCHHLGIANGFDHNRFIQFMKVLKVDDGKWHLCARDKEIFNLYEMFHTRFALHKRAYQHRVKNGIEHMISDAMVLANDELKISASAGKGNTTAYTRLGDGIFQKILYYEGQDEKSKEARKILERVVNRNLYKFVADEPYSGKERDVEAIRKKIAEGTGLSKDDMAVSLVKFNYGSGDKDPIQYFWFYEKNKNESGKGAYNIKREKVSKILPNVFEEYRIQVFSKNSKKTKDLKEVFEAWIGGKEKK